MKKTFLLLTLSSALLVATDSGVIFGLKDNGSLALRKAPVKGSKIGKLSNGDKLTILETKGKWHKVTVVSSGKTGWTHGDWVKIFPSEKTSIPNKVISTKVVTTKPVSTKKVQRQDIKSSTVKHLSSKRVDLSKMQP